MDFDEFMRLFHGAISAVEDGKAGEIMLQADAEDDEDRPLLVYVCIRRDPAEIVNFSSEDPRSER